MGSVVDDTTRPGPATIMNNATATIDLTSTQPLDIPIVLQTPASGTLYAPT